MTSKNVNRDTTTQKYNANLIFFLAAFKSCSDPTVPATMLLLLSERTTLFRKYLFTVCKRAVALFKMMKSQNTIRPRNATAETMQAACKLLAAARTVATAGPTHITVLDTNNPAGRSSASDIVSISGVSRISRGSL
ncbi:unnamed protein product, partial [Ectocarpus sp. 12 AP-2014]